MRITVGVSIIVGASLACALASATTPIPVGTVPLYVAANSTTNRIYVTNLNSNDVSVIDGVTDAVIATIPVSSSPTHIDVNPVTNRVYVVTYGANSVTVIDGASNSVIATVTAGMSSPWGISVNSITNQIFVSNNNSNQVAVIDGSTNTLLTTVGVGSVPVGIRVNASAGLAYVANNGSGTITVIDTNTYSVVNTFSLPSNAFLGNLGMDPLTNRLLLTDSSNEVVYVVDASTGGLLRTITGGAAPFKAPVFATVFQPGKTFMVSDYSRNAVSEFSESTYAAISGLRGGIGPEGIAVNRKTGKIYVAESSTDTVNVYTMKN